MPSHTPPFSEIGYQVEGRVATLVLNRPEKKNALSATLTNELIVALETASQDPAVRVVVLSGAGGVFCAGGDLSQMSGKPGAPNPAIPWRGGFVELNLAFAQLGKPAIAKIRGHALGGALGLVCGCHVALCDEAATFGLPEIDRGLFPMLVMASLFRTVGRRAGLELVLGGDRIDARRAVEIGLVNRAVPAEALDAEVAALADRLSRKPPEATRIGLEAFYRQDGMAYPDALPYLQDRLFACLGTADAREGMAAFLQKREPTWR
jgi:enoyl-CoA hydratase/carnithine racemase